MGVREMVLLNKKIFQKRFFVNPQEGPGDQIFFKIYNLLTALIPDSEKQVM